jgi:hypothetical protein
MVCGHNYALGYYETEWDAYLAYLLACDICDAVDQFLAGIVE